MREQGLSSKLLAFEKQLEDHEVAVLELERQVAVLQLGENFKQLSDLVTRLRRWSVNGRWLWRSLRLTSSGSRTVVNETKALEWERQLAVVEVEGNFMQLSERVNETKALVGLVDDQIVNTRKAFSAEVKGTSLAVAEFGVARQLCGCVGSASR